MHIRPQYRLIMFQSIKSIKETMSAMRLGVAKSTQSGRSDTDALYEDLAGFLAIEQPGPAKPKWLHDNSKYRKLIEKRARIHELLLAEPLDSFATKFRKCEDHEKRGYVQDHTRCSGLQLIWMKIGNVLQTIGLDSKFTDDGLGDNCPVNHDHSEAVNVEVKHYLATHASFCQVVNPVTGVVVAYDNVLPKAVLEAGSLKGLLEPELQHWSDVAYLQWLSHADSDSELRYVLRYNVLNDLSQFVVKTLENLNGTPPIEWPGTTYEGGTEEYLALPGTPNGSSTGYLLINHKAEFGHKTFDKITVFRQGRHEVMIFFHIVDVKATAHILEATD
jgi:hypothetical protein